MAAGGCPAAAGWAWPSLEAEATISISLCCNHHQLVLHVLHSAGQGRVGHAARGDPGMLQGLQEEAGGGGGAG